MLSAVLANISNDVIFVFVLFTEWFLFWKKNQIMEIDLPRMQSLSPHFDTSSPINSIPGMTNLTDIIPSTQSTPTSQPEPEPQSNSFSFSNDIAKNCDWKLDTEICGCKYERKSGCGCKYINKVSVSVCHENLFLNIKITTTRLLPNFLIIRRKVDAINVSCWLFVHPY